MLLLSILKWEERIPAILDSLFEHGVQLGWILLKAALVFIVGRVLVSSINMVIRKILDKRAIDPSVKTFIGSLINVVLIILLIISVVGALGVQTTSFAALLASAGVAIGMALSGNLANFAGGLIILVFKPFKVGDYIDAQSGVSGTVQEIQIFHTILRMVDNRIIYVPNGSLSSNAITNYNKQETRRAEWVFGVEYGEDYEKVKSVLERLIEADPRILKDPAPFIGLSSLSASSVDIKVRAWAKTSDYWDVVFDFNKTVYATFNKEGIGFPFPQLTVHQAQN